MFRSRQFLTATACAGALLLSACGASGTDTGSQTSVGAEDGDPVAGGTADVLQPAEPRSLDPASLSNTFSHQPVVGNALYGTLMINNLDTFEIEYKMATDFSTADGGTTFTLTLQPGLTFTDGTPLDASAVKFNWDRLRDPALGSTAIRQAAQVTNSEVVDPTTLTITLAAPNPHFPQGMLGTSMNWIASPAALQKGQAAFDENPVGAGPFTLTEWTRQSVIELEKNPATGMRRSPTWIALPFAPRPTPTSGSMRSRPAAQICRRSPVGRFWQIPRWPGSRPKSCRPVADRFSV